MGQPNLLAAALRGASVVQSGIARDLTGTAGAITVTDIDTRKSSGRTQALNREVLLSFWKVHILHHAGEEAIHGQWILNELRRHGYEISPGTLYPLLNRMERLGWLKGKVSGPGGQRARRDYRLTAEGKKVLGLLREQIEELYEEVARPGRKHAGQHR